MVAIAAALCLSFTLPAMAEDAADLCQLPETAGQAIQSSEGTLPTIDIEAGEIQQAASCICPSAYAPPRIAQGWACASSCAAATAACDSDAYNKADANCYQGVCDFGSLTYRPPGGCIYDDSEHCPGQYLRDCDLEYWCWKCPFEQEL
jgi:hypothetical protein